MAELVKKYQKLLILFGIYLTVLIFFNILCRQTSIPSPIPSAKRTTVAVRVGPKPLVTCWPKISYPKPAQRPVSSPSATTRASLLSSPLRKAAFARRYNRSLLYSPLSEPCQPRESTKTSADGPIIYIAHSLGGLVVANAVSRPHCSDKTAERLTQNAIGMIFLGTPLAGSDMAVWAKWAQDLHPSYFSKRRALMSWTFRNSQRG
jgi:hypothetical protein